MNLVYRFGNFELDGTGGELRRSGLLVKLPPLPMGVLELLVENPGELVTREQIQRRAWGDRTFVDFDRNLNVCMAQIRAALNDDAEAPRFIRTVPRRGYTFLAQVEKTVPEAAPTVRSFPWLWALLIALVAIVAAVVAYRGWRDQRVMIAVLPFESTDSGALADGLLDELIGDLGSLPSTRLGVIARSSVMRYKGAHGELKGAGHELNIGYVVEGTVRRNGARVRVTAQLVKISDQAVLWADAYEDDEPDLFRMEQEASSKIAAAVAAHLFPDRAPPSSIHTVGREAYEAYRTGRTLQSRGTRADLERSLDRFAEAVRQDPRYPQAYAALADTYVSLARSGGDPKQLFPQAAAAAEKALSLDDSVAEAHNALANVRFWYDWKWNEAERHFTRALEINPSYAAAYHDQAWLLVALGRTEAGLSSLRRAIAFDPLSVRINIDAGWLLLQAHRYDEAIRQARRALELEPGLAEAQFCIRRALQYQHKTDVPAPAGTSSYNRAVLAASAGDRSKALDELDHAYDERSLMMTLLKVDPAFLSLHGDPRFDQLLHRIGIP